ncbi:unnamed protein product [Gordionus sp. m RMFG-2023]|uniref:alpha-soluble NSF attachment protein-like n=1 Tax=Gordionus sp. m RMFG-2023 TaxID=3053472 RepID=UPI0030E3640F
MGDSEQKALNFMAEGEKKCHSSKGILSSMFGKESATLDSACECFEKAANNFKIAKNWTAAGKAFVKSAEIHGSMGNKHESANKYYEGANCFKKSDHQDAVKCLLKAIDIYTDLGRFTIAAKYHANLAEIYENELKDINKAIQHYEQAADYFRGEESNSAANKYSLIVAGLEAERDNYNKAIKIYEQVAMNSMDNSLLKYSVKDHFYKAALCHLCIDPLNGEQALERYEQLYPAFSDSRECKFLKALLQNLTDQNSEGFTETVKNYDSISRLDQWTTSLLLKLKRTISDEGDLR